MPQVQIFGFAGSTYVRTARMVCEEKHVNYELEPLEFGAASHRALHPFAHMPAMRIGATLLYETLAIACYVDDTFEGPRMTPSEPLARAHMLQWISTCNDYLHRSLVRGLFDDAQPDDEATDRARRSLEVVDAQLREGPFLLGGEITLCDLFLAPIIAFAEQQQAGATLFGAFDGIAGWRERVWSRASFVATRA